MGVEFSKEVLAEIDLLLSDAWDDFRMLSCGNSMQSPCAERDTPCLRHRKAAIRQMIADCISEAR